jgi:hypothetical protein
MKISLFRHASRRLPHDEYETMLASAEVLERDAFGIKVLRLGNGDILKIFRVKRFISSARFCSYARRFCRNAGRLAALGIPTVSVRELYHFPDSTNTAVLYAPLRGMTLRELLRNETPDVTLWTRLGAFVATLHEKGIYFRSLHFGNIVLTSDSHFGLIDIADMHFLPWRLGCGRRLRNFRHLRRLDDDVRLLGVSGWQAMLDGYIQHKPLPENCRRRIKSLYNQSE